MGEHGLLAAHTLGDIELLLGSIVAIATAGTGDCTCQDVLVGIVAAIGQAPYKQTHERIR
jgi:hypothetical protein